MTVDMNRFIEKLNRINAVGFEPDMGISRLALTGPDFEARKIVKSYFEDMGLEVREDKIGNIIGRKAGTDASLPSVLVGSHIDTVPGGGAYDGTLGVIAAAEAVQMMIDHEIEHEHPVEIVVFSIEESSRFNVSTVGSKIITNRLGLDALKYYKDKEGQSIHDALSAHGILDQPMTYVTPETVKAFVELHIEQGPILERKGIDIGIVEAIAAPSRMRIKLIGEEAHSGSCPMEMRRDALTTASKIIVEVEKKGREESKYKTVATVGNCEVYPGAMNVVPGQAIISIDIRGVDVSSILRTFNYITERTKEICEENQTDYRIEIISQEKPVILDEALQSEIQVECETLGLSYQRMLSGAGHDTMNLAKLVPSSLIFIPCVKGVSHNKNEAVNPRDLENGLKILYKTLVKLAKKNA